MSLQSKREYLGQIRSRYHRAGRVHKSKILDEYCLVCGYDRKYAIKRLANDPPRPRRKPGRQPRYDKELLLPVLQRVWLASDQMCSKRLRAALPKWLPHRRARALPFLERAPDGHRFADAFHLRGERGVGLRNGGRAQAPRRRSAESW